MFITNCCKREKMDLLRLKLPDIYYNELPLIPLPEITAAA